MRFFATYIPLVLVGAVWGSLGGSLANAQDAEEPPNVVLIVADDLGYGDLGSYGQTQIRTPNLDQMAREGLRFTQFYAGSTVCAPSRSVLMTGQHTGRTPVRGNSGPVRRRTGNKYIDGPIGDVPLPNDTETLADVLQEQGYATGAFGKWGLGGPGSEGIPTKHGFDEFFGYIDHRSAHFYYPEFLFEARGGGAVERVSLEGNQVVSDPYVPGAGHPIESETYSHDVIMEETLSFVDRHREEEPFFLYLPVTIPHPALSVPEEAREPYLTKEGTSIFNEDPFSGGHYPPQSKPYATYAAMVSRLDRDVGRLLDKLQALGLDENTIVLFTSDNGPHDAGGYDPSALDSNGPLREGKGTLYEGGIRAPMIAWGPGCIPAAAQSHHKSYFGDLMATFSELVGTEPPKPNDSVSFLPTLRGHEDQQQTHEALYWEYYGGETQQAVRYGKWKALRRPMLKGAMELYNLERDLSERKNVADDHPQVVNRIKEIMEEKHTPPQLWPEPTEE